MGKIVFTVSKDLIRHMDHPNQEDHMMTEHIVRVYLGDIELNQIKEENNPRSHEEGEMRGPVVNAIKETLEQSPKDFTTLNRGLVLTASKVAVSPVQGKKDCLEVSVDMPDDKSRGHVSAKHGCADGGTSMSCMKKVQSEAKIVAFTKDENFQREQFSKHRRAFVEAGINKIPCESTDVKLTDEQLAEIAKIIHVADLPEEFIKAFNLDQILVPMTIFSGNPSSKYLEKLCEARNTSKQVKPVSLINHAGGFGFYKDAIKDEPYANNIAWDEFAPEDISGEDCLAIMDGFRQMYNNEDDPKQPVKSYSGQNSVVKQYDTNSKASKKKGSSAQEDAALLCPVIADINRLHDIIMSEGAYLIKNRKGCRAVECRPAQLQFLGEETKIYLHKGVRLPVLFSFRCLVGFDPTTKLAYWKTNPFEFWQANKDKLIAKALAIFNDPEQGGGDPGHFGKTANYYEQLFTTANLLYYKSMKKAV